MKWVKKLGLILGIVAAAIFIGNSVSGWVSDAKDKDTTDPAATGSESAVVSVVAE